MSDRDRILALREDDYTYAEIALRTGLSISKVRRVLNPEQTRAGERFRRAKKEAWARANYRGRCYCGALTTKRNVKRCLECTKARRREVQALVLDTIQAMYEADWPIREMSEAFGHKTPQGVEPWLSQLVKAGRIQRRRPRRNSR